MDTHQAIYWLIYPICFLSVEKIMHHVHKGLKIINFLRTKKALCWLDLAEVIKAWNTWEQSFCGRTRLGSRLVPLYYAMYLKKCIRNMKFPSDMAWEIKQWTKQWTPKYYKGISIAIQIHGSGGQDGNLSQSYSSLTKWNGSVTKRVTKLWLQQRIWWISFIIYLTYTFCAFL